MINQPTDAAEQSEPETSQDEVAQLFETYVKDGKIAIDHGINETTGEKSERYIVARFTDKRDEAVAIVERLEMIHHFDRIKQICFVNGMVDGITSYLKEIQKLNKPLMTEKSVQVGRGILAFIEDQRKKI